ncbi:MAG: hypothetical protein V4642_10495 [Bacteroidota bacterium]
MGKFLKSVVIISAMLITFSSAAYADGRKVTLFLKDGTQKSGELLSVRDSLISFLKEAVEEDEDIADHPEIVAIAFLKDIDKVRVEENDVSGAGTGALIGGGIYTAFGVAVFGGDDIGNVLISAAGGAIFGAGIGWLVGAFMSEDEETIRPLAKGEIRYLEEFARLYEGEPRYVRDIIDNLVKAQK